MRSPTKKMKSRSRLHKSNKKIQPKPFLQPIISDLKQNKLSNLNLANRSLQDKDIKPLLPLISKAANLRRVILKKNKLTDRTVDQICGALRNSSVELLDLSYNKLSPACFTHFRKLATYNRSLKYVLIKNNDIPVSIKMKKVIEFKKMGVAFDPK